MGVNQGVNGRIIVQIPRGESSMLPLKESNNP